MPNFKELNDTVRLADQLQSNEDGSVVLINLFTIEPQDEEALPITLKVQSHRPIYLKS